MILRRQRIAAGLVSIATLCLPLTVVPTTADAASYHYRNCIQLHKHFKHGVGKKHAKDHVKKGSSSKPVTNFKHSTKIYKAAVKFNRALDRDHDRVACEKH